MADLVFQNNYQPYPMDWRFLPEWALVSKDLVRRHRVRLSSDIAQRSLLTSLWRATAGRRTQRSLEGAKMLFIHIPKTGGTSISQCLYGRNLPHYTAPFYASVFPELMAELPSFAVIRDPVERLKSAYRFIRAGGTEIMAVNRYDMLQLNRVGDFDSFVDFLCMNPDYVFLFEALGSQINYVQDDGRILVDHLFKLDTRYGLPEQLCDLIGVRHIPHLNATKGPDQRVSSATAEKIGLLFRDDTKLFNDLSACGGAAMSVKGRSLQSLAPTRH